MTYDEMKLVLDAALSADDGCSTCVSGVVRRLVLHMPYQDWEGAARDIKDNSVENGILEGREDAQA